MLKLVVCDWNRTLFRDHFEESFFKQLSREVLWDHLSRAQVRTGLGVFWTGLKCYLLNTLARFDRPRTLDYVRQINEMLSPAVFRGMTPEFLEQYTRRYGPRMVGRLDRRLLGPLHRQHVAGRFEWGIISSGYVGGIESTLRCGGYDVDFVIANNFSRRDERIYAYRISVLDNKLELLEERVASRGLDWAEVMYIGDNEQDIECMQRVGHPVVSLLASTTNRRRLTDATDAFAPSGEADFERHLAERVGH